MSENLPNETSFSLQGVFITLTCQTNQLTSGEFCFFTLIICLFLEQTATACINLRLANPVDTTADPDEACEPGPPFDPEQNTSPVFSPQ